MNLQLIYEPDGSKNKLKSVGFFSPLEKLLVEVIK